MYTLKTIIPHSDVICSTVTDEPIHDVPHCLPDRFATNNIVDQYITSFDRSQDPVVIKSQHLTTGETLYHRTQPHDYHILVDGLMWVVEKHEDTNVLGETGVAYTHRSVYVINQDNQFAFITHTASKQYKESIASNFFDVHNHNLYIRYNRCMWLVFHTLYPQIPHGVHTINDDEQYMHKQECVCASIDRDGLTWMGFSKTDSETNITHLVSYKFEDPVQSFRLVFPNNVIRAVHHPTTDEIYVSDAHKTFVFGPLPPRWKPELHHRYHDSMISAIETMELLNYYELIPTIPHEIMFMIYDNLCNEVKHGVLFPEWI